MTRRTIKQQQEDDLITEIEHVQKASEARERDWDKQAAVYRREIRKLRLQLITAQAEADGLRLALDHIVANIALPHPTGEPQPFVPHIVVDDNA